MQSLAPEDVIRIHSESDEGAAIIQALLSVLGIQSPAVLAPWHSDCYK